MKNKNNLIETPEDLTLYQISERFATEDAAFKYWEAIYWPDGPVCPHCKNAKAERIFKLKPNLEKKIRHGLYHCGECQKQFTAKIGTIFEGSHIPLQKWLIAWYMICSSKKGVSSLQLQRSLSIGCYRTALFMCHRIRYALQDPVFKTKLMGTVEVDETYVGGKKRGMGRRYTGNKTPVVALLERNGRVRSSVMPRVNGRNLKAVMEKNITPKSTIMTDQYPAYRKAARRFAKHETVNHSAREYVRGLAHTNGVESNFSLLKRGVIGTFHSLSAHRLPLYLAEFDHRHNTRHMTDGQRTVAGLKKAGKKKVLYREHMSR